MNDLQAIRVGVLDDLSKVGDAGYRAVIEAGMAAALAKRPLDRPVELDYRWVTGLPRGSVQAVRDAYGELRDSGIVAMLGPTITDNVLALRDLADAAGLPTLTWPGGEACRSEFVFQYQAGSLEDEPPLIARHLADRGLARVVVVHDHAETGNRLAECFDRAASAHGLLVLSRLPVPALSAPVPQSFFDEVVAHPPDAIVHLGLFGIRALAEGLRARGIDLPVVSNIVASIGQTNSEWAEALEGWVYVDMVSEDNRQLQAVRSLLPPSHAKGPRMVTGLDVGRLLVEALANAVALTPRAVKDGFEAIKQVPACAGRDGTVMGFGYWDRAALKGEYLVLRQYVDGVSVLWEE